MKNEQHEQKPEYDEAFTIYEPIEIHVMPVKISTVPEILAPVYDHLKTDHQLRIQ